MSCGINALALVLVGLIVVLLVLSISNSREGMEAMDDMSLQYELQDNYRNVPQMWPIPYTSITALYAREREALERGEIMGRV